MKRLLLLVTLISAPVLAQWEYNVPYAGGSALTAASPLETHLGAVAFLVYMCNRDDDETYPGSVSVMLHDASLPNVDRITGEASWWPGAISGRRVSFKVVRGDNIWLVFPSATATLERVRRNERVKVEIPGRRGTYEFNFDLRGSSRAIDWTRRTCNR